MTEEVKHFIAGKAVSSSGRKLEIYNPMLGKVIKHLYVADQPIIEEAILAAQNAFISWSNTTSLQRAKILFCYKELLDANINQLAEIISTEHGKTLQEALGSVQRGIDVVEFACGITSHLKGEFAEEVTQGMDAYSLRQPLGVCVGITPFNFPGMIPLWMFPVAIACGNTFILKPSEKDPSCSVKLVELAKMAGVPDGVVNVIQGDKEVVDALIIHNSVKAVSFVGSSTVAENVYKTAIAHNKRAQAFGGAKNHCVVMPDADIDQAVDAIVASAFGSAGERCMAISVVVAVGDQLAEQLQTKIQQKLKQQNISPLITQAHWERVQSYIELGKKEGAKLIVDGSRYKPENNSEGFYLGACLFDHVQPNMRIYQEEIFGPVLSIVRVNNFSAAINLVNTHVYGNGAAVFTRDGFIARNFAEQVQVGMVGINVPVPVPAAQHSFGGWKNSIFGDAGMYGMEAVRFFTKLKTVTLRWFPKETL